MNRAPVIDQVDLGQSSAEVAALWTRNLAGYDEPGALTKLRHGYLENPAGTGAVLALRV